MQIKDPPASPGGTGDDPDYTTISGGKRRQCVMEMESSRAATLPGAPDSPYTTAVRGCFSPMDNGNASRAAWYAGLTLYYHSSWRKSANGQWRTSPDAG